MIKWEYLTEELDYIQFTDDHFNNNGKDGWELVTVQIQKGAPRMSFYAVYKRELIENGKENT